MTFQEQIFLMIEISSKPDWFQFNIEDPNAHTTLLIRIKMKPYSN